MLRLPLFLLLVIPSAAPAQQPPDPDVVASIKKAHDDFYKTLKDFSFLYLHTQYDGDLITSHSLTEHIRDRDNKLTFNRLPCTRGNWDITRPTEPMTESATLSRTRGDYLQIIGLQRLGRFKPWIQSYENSYTLDEANRMRGDSLEAMLLHPTFIPLRCSASYNTTITALFQHPSFRITSKTEDRSGPDRLLTFDFVLDPPPKPPVYDFNDPVGHTRAMEAYINFVRGRITLRPDHDWTLASSTIHFPAREQVAAWQSTTSIDYYADVDRKIFPKAFKTTSNFRLDKNKQRIEQTSRGTFEFKLYDRLPPETFSLTQFALPEHDHTPPEPEATPTKTLEKRSYLSPSNILPPYAWFTLGALTTLVLVLLPRLLRPKKKPSGSWNALPPVS